MKTIEKMLKPLTVLLGSASLIFLIVSWFILESLRPKMISFELITSSREALLNYFGITLLLLFGFCLLSFYRIAAFLKKAKKITVFYLLLLFVNIICFVFIFGDLALINDIGKQYKYGLAQPEWLVLYIVMVSQLFSAGVLTYANDQKLTTKDQIKYIARDSNVFITAQYVGLLCGAMGLVFIGLNSRFPRNLGMMKLHTIITSVFLLIPYFLIIGFWGAVKIREKSRQLYDEKQIQDIGKSAFATLIIAVFAMGALFVINFNGLNGVLSILWFPFLAFLILFLFSLANIYLINKN